MKTGLNEGGFSGWILQVLCPKCEVSSTIGTYHSRQRLKLIALAIDYDVLGESIAPLGSMIQQYVTTFLLLEVSLDERYLIGALPPPLFDNCFYISPLDAYILRNFYYSRFLYGPQMIFSVSYPSLYFPLPSSSFPFPILSSCSSLSSVSP